MLDRGKVRESGNFQFKVNHADYQHATLPSSCYLSFSHSFLSLPLHFTSLSHLVAQVIVVGGRSGGRFGCRIPGHRRLLLRKCSHHGSGHWHLNLRLLGRLDRGRPSTGRLQMSTTVRVERDGTALLGLNQTIRVITQNR